MPLEDYHYEKILDDIYETASEGEDEYFSDSGEKLWAMGAIAQLSVQPVEPVRYRRKKAQEKTKLQLRHQDQTDAAVNISKTDALPRLPGYIPAFSERTVSAAIVTPPLQPRPAKRYQSSPVIDEPSTPRGAKNRLKNTLPSSSADSLPGWSVDESDMIEMALDRVNIAKYNEFKAAVAEANCNPLDSRHFDGRRWDIKLTNQKSGYKLYRIRLIGQYRASFIVDNDKRKVMMMKASRHDN